MFLPAASVRRPLTLGVFFCLCVSVNCNIFLCDDSDCGDSCRVVEGRDQVEVAPDMGIVYGNVRDANGEDFEIDLEAGTTYGLFVPLSHSLFLSFSLSLPLPVRVARSASVCLFFSRV